MDFFEIDRTMEYLDKSIESVKKAPIDARIIFPFEWLMVIVKEIVKQLKEEKK